MINLKRIGDIEKTLASLPEAVAFVQRMEEGEARRAEAARVCGELDAYIRELDEIAATLEKTVPGLTIRVRILRARAVEAREEIDVLLTL